MKMIKQIKNEKIWGYTLLIMAVNLLFNSICEKLKIESDTIIEVIGLVVMIDVLYVILKKKHVDALIKKSEIIMKFLFVGMLLHGIVNIIRQISGVQTALFFTIGEAVIILSITIIFLRKWINSKNV